MRSQAGHRPQGGPAKLLEGSPTLMRLRELEVLEKVATNSKLNVVLGRTFLFYGRSFRPETRGIWRKRLIAK